MEHLSFACFLLLFFPIIHLSKFRPSSKPQTQPQEIQSSSSEQFTVLPAQEKIEQE